LAVDNEARWALLGIDHYIDQTVPLSFQRDTVEERYDERVRKYCIFAGKVTPDVTDVRGDLVSLEALQLAIVSTSDTLDLGEGENLLRLRRKHENVAPIRLLSRHCLKSKLAH
jgi:hypothetical protein